MFETLSPGATQMQSSTPEVSPSSESLNNSASVESADLERLVRRLDAVVAKASLHDVMIAMASVLSKRCGKTHFGLISHTLSSMMAVARSESGFKPIPEKKQRSRSKASL